jgi:hypothetical protein
MSSVRQVLAIAHLILCFLISFIFSFEYVPLYSELSSDLYYFSSQVRVNYVIPLFLVVLAVWLALVHYT